MNILQLAETSIVNSNSMASSGSIMGQHQPRPMMKAARAAEVAKVCLRRRVSAMAAIAVADSVCGRWLRATTLRSRVVGSHKKAGSGTYPIKLPLPNKCADSEFTALRSLFAHAKYIICLDVSPSIFQLVVRLLAQHVATHTLCASSLEVVD